jgi:phosphoserine phosphatase
MTSSDHPSQETVVPDATIVESRQTALMTLVQITCELAAHHELDEILRIVTEGVCKALACERGSLFLYDASREELFTRMVTELEIEEIRHSVEEGITGWVSRCRKVANIADPTGDARWISAVDRQTGFHTRNILAAPVVSSHDDRLLGVLQVLNKAEGSFDEFDEQLICAFAAHAANALERSHLLHEAKKTHELELAIDMGRRIQQGFLPERLPEIPGYELAAWWEPAEAVSGDYYDVVSLPDGRLGFVVADVSGHGVGASLIMASTRAMLHVLVRTFSEPDQILTILTESISPDLTHGRFVTCLMATLNPRTHEVTYANAGQGPVLHFHRAESTFTALDPTGLPLGFDPREGIGAGEPFQLEPGDLLLLTTDGAVELRDASGEMFGRERLERLVIENSTLPAGELVDLLRDRIRSFHPNEHPPDDVTILVLKRKQG